MYTFATLDQFRLHLGYRAADAPDETPLRRALEAASRGLEAAAERRFQPYTAAVPVTPAAANLLILPADLLTLTSLTDAGGILPPAALRPLPADPPHTLIELTGGRAFLTTEAAPAVTVTGWWGWHDDPARLWRDSLDALTAPVTAADRVLPVAGWASADAAFEAPRFGVGALLRIDDELLRVVRLESPTQLGVLRGVNGTTAAPHSAAALVRVWQPPRLVHALTLTWAAALYAGMTPPAPADFAALRRLRV